MTNKPREFWVYEGKRNCNSLRFVYTNPQTIKQVSPENWDEFYVIEAGPALEKIKRLEAALEQCKDQRDWWVHEKYEGAETKDIDALVEQENARLESILEGR